MMKWKEVVMNKNIISLLESAKAKLSPWVIEWATFDKSASEASSKIEEVINELKKPSLEDYIQALPNITFEDYGECNEKRRFQVSNDGVFMIVPYLYKQGGKWLMEYMDGCDGESIMCFEGFTPMDAAKSAYKWCVKEGLIKDTLHG